MTHERGGTYLRVIRPFFFAIDWPKHASIVFSLRGEVLTGPREHGFVVFSVILQLSSYKTSICWVDGVCINCKLNSIVKIQFFAYTGKLDLILNGNYVWYVF